VFSSSNCSFLFHLDRHCCFRRRQACDLLIFNKDVTLGNLDFIRIWDTIWLERERERDRQRKSVVLSRSTNLVSVHAVGEAGRACFYSCCNNFRHSLISGWWCIHVLRLCLSSLVFVMKMCGQRNVARYTSCIPTGCQKQVNYCAVYSLRLFEMNFRIDYKPEGRGFNSRWSH
jgi:hypothetical protein